MTVDRSCVALSIALAASSIPLAAVAQPSYASRGETISGTIASVQNVNHLYLADDRGYTDDVTLRAGAAVISNGVRLEPGERVTIVGSAAGPTFLANRIATSGPSYADGAASSTVYAPSYYSTAYYETPAYYSYLGYGPYAYYGYQPFFTGVFGYGYPRFYGGYFAGGYGLGFGFGFGTFARFGGYGYGGYGRGYGYGGYGRGYGYGGYGYGGYRGAFAGGYRGGSFGGGYRGGSFGGGFRGAAGGGFHGGGRAR